MVGEPFCSPWLPSAAVYCVDHSLTVVGYGVGELCEARSTNYMGGELQTARERQNQENADHGDPGCYVAKERKGPRVMGDAEGDWEMGEKTRGGWRRDMDVVGGMGQEG